MRTLTVLSLVAVLLLSGCGFHLRGSQSEGRETIVLSALHILSPNPYGPIMSRLRNALQRAGVVVVERQTGTVYSLRLSIERNSRRSIATSSSSGAAEYELRQEVDFELSSGSGEVVVPRLVLFTERTYSFDASSLESSSQEETQLQNEMRDDLARQILRRVNATVSRLESAADS